MASYNPGSFTKNLGWAKTPPGLRALYEAIRTGFGGTIKSVSRKDFRQLCGISDNARQLIPINFFLHNTIVGGVNFISIDELVRHALTSAHSTRFDFLALFAMQLARQGRRAGVAGDPKGAGFTNEFVRTSLWGNGGWLSARLTETAVEAAFKSSIVAVGGSDTVHKCMTNYMFILETCGLRRQKTQFINTRIDEWIGPGLFLAFDRFWLDDFAAGTPTRDELVAMVKAEEIYKLMGAPEAYVRDATELFAQEYLDLGGVRRSIAAAVAGPSPSGPVPASPAGTPPWTDEDAEEMATVMRRLRETQAQIRTARHVRELKALYDHTCALCGKQTIIGVDPDQHYSEAAHIKPVGSPHSGPDAKSNMLILCPEHHLQFDRGVLTLRFVRGKIVARSKIPGDPLNGRVVTVKWPHTIDEQFVKWHAAFWR